ncbi:hypothetical protein ACWCXX_40110 [Streptomyces sp. NPDC001732]
MTTADQLDRAVADPIGLITDLVTDVEKELGAERIRAVVTAVAGGRAKSRSLAKALAIRPALLTDGRSPAPRAIGDLLIELRKAGASAIAAPVCAECGKQLRTLQRKGQDWYCSVCTQETAECTACGNVRRVSFRDCQRPCSSPQRRPVVLPIDGRWKFPGGGQIPPRPGVVWVS